MPVEQPRRKREVVVANRRMNALKHQHTHPATHTHPAIFKDAFGSAKIGEISLIYLKLSETERIFFSKENGLQL